jgi:putative membrane protein
MKHKIKQYWQLHNEVLAIYITGFFLLAGILQYWFGLTYVLQLTPLIIGVLAAVTILYWNPPAQRKLWLVISALSIGMVAEIIGVQTGLLFGEYSYGTVLGLKVFGVPLLIGVTWALVTVSAWQIVSYSTFGKVAKIILASCLVVLFDLVLEQYATAFGLWKWQDGIIPLKNYITWFVVSGTLFTLYSFYSKQEKPSIYGATVLPAMTVFFWLMLLVR